MYSCGSEILVMIGKWLVAVGLSNGITAHCVSIFEIPSVQKTLSILDYFLVTMCWRVGVPLGSAMSKLYVARSSMRPLAALVACCVNR